MTRIFISHSHSDEVIAYKLVTFLLAALSIKEEEILCSSNPDQGLSYSSSSVPDQLKKELKNSEALIVLITADSLHSAWIPFEVGSFWTTNKPIIPILGPSLTHDDLPGPLRSLLSIPIDVQDWEHKVNNAINQLVEQLEIQQKVTKRRNDTLKEFSDALRAWQSQRPAPKPASQEEIEQLKTQMQDLKRLQKEPKNTWLQKHVVKPYQGNTKENVIDQAFRLTKSEIWISGINLSQSARNRYNILEQSLIKGISLRFLFFNHTNQSLLTKVSEDLYRETFTLLDEADYSYKTLNYLIQKTEKSLNASRKVHIKITEKIPKAFVYVFDPPKEPKQDDPEGKTIFMPYMIGRDSTQRPAFECRNIEGGVWNYFYQGIQQEWKDAKPINEVINCSQYPMLDYPLDEGDKSENN